MKIIPAIDLFKGRVARLSRGDPETAKYYEAFGDPVQTALRWKKEGAGYLHLVDLDAAMESGNNRVIIHRILKEVSIRVQVGGGLRSAVDVHRILALGASRAILGTLVFADQGDFRQLLSSVGNKRLVVALDYSENRIVTRGWTQKTELTLSEAIENLIRIGVRMFLLTAVGRDGLLVGPDLENLSRCTQFPGVKIIAAGGISSLADIRELEEIGVDEVVVGKALYEGRIMLKDVLAMLRDQDRHRGE